MERCPFVITETAITATESCPHTLAECLKLGRLSVPSADEDVEGKTIKHEDYSIHKLLNACDTESFIVPSSPSS